MSFLTGDLAFALLVIAVSAGAYPSFSAASFMVKLFSNLNFIIFMLILSITCSPCSALNL